MPLATFNKLCRRFQCRFLLLTFLVLLGPASRAQSPGVATKPPTLPQLWQALREHPQPDTGRVTRLLRLEAFGFGTLPVARLDSLNQEALALSRHLNYPDGQAMAQMRYIGTAFLKGIKPDTAQLRQILPLAERSADKRIQQYVLLALVNLSGKAGLPYLLRARAAAQASGKPALVVAEGLAENRYFNLVLHDNYQALLAAARVLPVARRAGLAVEEVQALEAIGDVYVYLNDYEQAQASYRQELPLARALPDTTLRARWQCTALTGLADCDRLTGRYAQALAGYQQALRLAHALNVELIVKIRVADTYERQHNAESLPYARQVLRQAISLKSGAYQASIYKTLGQYFLRVGLPDSAVYYGQRALSFKNDRAEKEDIRDAMLLLSRAYAQKKQYEQAYTYRSHYASLRDSLNNEQTARQATAARYANDLALQKSQIGLLTRNQRLQATAARQRFIINLCLLGGVALLLVLSVFFYWAFRRSERLKLLVTNQKQDLQSQRDQLDTSLTKLRATQAQLIQAEKMASLGELTAGIAHEIQNPLNFVNNFSDVSAELMAELAEAQAAGDGEEVTALAADVRQNLRKITEHGQRAASIVRGMLEHSRASTGERAPTNINALADEYLRLAYHGLRAKDKTFNAALETDFAPGLPLVEAVSQDLGRVLLNLFNNAFYAVQQRQQAGEPSYAPTVRVATKQVGQQVEIRVSDNGTGMPEDVRAKIFQPFFTTKPTGEGTGLGLSLAHDIIAQGHGGTLAVASQPGRGTEFSIILPN